MRSLHADLLAAQQARTHQPYVEYLRCTSRRWGVQPLGVSSLYAEPAAGQEFAACVTPDGSVCRARITGSGDVYSQRVADPLNATAAAWSAWTLVAAGAAGSVQPPALAASASYVNLAYVKPDGYTLVRRFSSNNGVTWSGEVSLAADAAAPVRAVGIAARAGVNERLFVWAAGPNTLGGDSVELRYRTLAGSGAYGAITVAALPKFGQVEGLALDYAGDYHVAITGQIAQGDRPWGVFLTLLGDGFAYPAGTWAQPGTLHRTDSETEYGYSLPSLAQTGGAYRCAFWTRRPGGPDRLEATHRVSPDYGTTGWTTPAPIATPDSPALLLVLPSGTALLAGERSVWTATTVSQTVELVGRLRGYSYREPGALDVMLSDTDGWSASAEYSTLRPGAGMQLSRGLATASGLRSVPLPEREVVSVERIIGDGKSVRVRCRGAFEALGSWRANRSVVWPGDTPLAYILEAVCAYGGVKLAISASLSAQASRQPDWTVGPNESGTEAARRLLELVPERLRPQDDWLQMVDPDDAASTPYTYGYGGHPLLSWQLGDLPLEPNHVQVYARSGATTLYGEALDAEQVLRLGQRLLKLYDASISIASEASDLASARLALSRRSALTGAIRSLPNLGLEMWDRVEMRSDATAPSETRTVTGFVEAYNPSKGEWSQTVTLGGKDA